MFKKYLNGLRLVSTVIAFSFIIIPCGFSSPSNGSEYSFYQPDGKDIKLKVFGDEYYREYETDDGYTVVPDSDSKFYYADLSADGNEYIKTNARYGKDAPPHNKKKLRINRTAAKKKHQDAFVQSAPGGPNPAPIQTPTSWGEAVIGTKKVLVVRVDFSDSVWDAGLPYALVDNFYNQASGYTGNFGDMNGSVYEYWKTVSNQKLDLNSIVTTTVYRASHPKTYYSTYALAQDLVVEALNYFKAQGFDFTQLSTNSSGRFMAIGMMYAGNPTGSNGLWPHAGSITDRFTANGVNSDRYYVIQNGVTNPGLGPCCHEMGHAIMGWGETYDYDSTSAGLGDYCLMAYFGGYTGPVPPNAFLRYKQGWEDVTEVDSSFCGTLETTSNAYNTTYMYTNPGDLKEGFMIESRKKSTSGPNKNLPDEGLVIWHIDANKVNNTEEQRTAALHYFISLEQADGLYSMEANTNTESTDLFHGNTGNAQFTDSSTPNSKWWAGTASGLRITNISVAGDYMTFDVGSAGCATSTPTNGSPQPTRTPTETATPTATTCAGQQILGKTASGASTTDNTGYLDSTKYTLATAGNALAIYVRVTANTGGKLKGAIYANSGTAPGTLVIDAPEITPVTGWNRIDIPSTALAAGTYWLAFQTTAGVSVGYDVGVVGDEYYRGSFTYAAFPSPYGAGTSGNWKWDIYVQVCPDTGTPTPTATPTITLPATATPTSTATSTATATAATSTPTSTATDTPTKTSTATNTATATNSATASSTGTPTWTPTNTFTSTPTNTESRTPTPSYTATQTSTGSPVPTWTWTDTPTATATNSQVATNSYTPTATATATNSQVPTNSYTPTATATLSATFTPTATQEPGGTLEFGGDKKILVYPHPVTGVKDVNLGFNITKSANQFTLKIYTAGFRHVIDMEAKGTYHTGDNVITLPKGYTAGLATGTYYCVAIVKDGSGNEAKSKIGILIIIK